MSATPSYSLHERIWHWLQAAGMVALILTGFAVHYPDRFGILGSMANAVRWHSWIGFGLILNAFLGIFYHVTAEKYHHFIPRMYDFSGAAVRQHVSIYTASLEERSILSRAIRAAS